MPSKVVTKRAELLAAAVVRRSRELEPLVGATVVAAEAVLDDDSGMVVSVLALRLADGSLVMLEPLRDEEGNGPGVLLVRPPLPGEVS